MKKRNFFHLGTALFFLYIGCRALLILNGEGPPHSPSDIQDSKDIKRIETVSQLKAQKLQVIKVGRETLMVEIARTPLEHERGLSFRKTLEWGRGMLFIFDKEQQLSFWMKNTFIPLSIGFFDKNKKLLNILDMTPVKQVGKNKSLRLYKSKGPALYALEVPQGWFKKKSLRPGARLHLNVK